MPGPEYRGTDLWMLNDKLEDTELKRQIEEMKEKGCGAFIARTFRGLKSDYPGKNFMDRMRVIIETAKETGLKVFLQAGYMPGGIPELPDEYTHTVIKKAEKNEEAATDGEILCKCNDAIYYRSKVKYTLDLLNPDAMKYYMKLAYEDTWVRFKDEFGKTIVSVWVDEPHFIPPDLPWTEKLPEQFQKMWGYNIQEKVELLFIDKDDYRTVRYHYWRTILHMLKNSYFEVVSKWCREHNLKFSGHLMGEDTFERQVGFTCSVMPLYKYMDIPGIDHLTNSMEWPNYQAKFLMTPLQCVSAAYQAGKKDILCEMYGVSTQSITFERQKYIFDYFASLGITRRCVHGIFYSLKGQRKRFYAPHISYQQPWWKYYKEVTDYCARVSALMYQGEPMVDVLVLHPIETAFMEYKSSVSISKSAVVSVEYDNKNEIFRMDKRFPDFLRNLLGMQLPFNLGDEDTIAEWGKIEEGKLKVGQMYYKTVIIPDLKVIRKSTLKILRQFAAEGGNIIVKGQAPYMIDGTEDKRFEEIEGVKYVDGFSDLKKVISKICKRDFIFESSDDSTSIWINMKTIDDGRIAFVFNNDTARGRKGTLNINGLYDVEVWNAEDGTINRVNAKIIDGITKIDVELEAGGSKIFVLKQVMDAEKCSASSDLDVCDVQIENKQARNFQAGNVQSCDRSDDQSDDMQAAVVVNSTELMQSLDISGIWSVERKDPNVLPLEFCRFKKEDGDYSEIYPILAVQQILTKEDYRGQITLKFEFEVSYVPEDIKLAIEEPEEYSILINGKSIKMEKTGEYYRDKSFEIVNIAGTLREGLNFIEATRYFEPLQKPKSVLTSLFQNLSGVELEEIYLIGDFGVYGTLEPTDTGYVKFSRDFSLGLEQKHAGRELTMVGYPFYAGSIVLSKTINISDINYDVNYKKAILKVDDFRACIGKVFINGKYAGSLRWKPYEVDITGLLVWGENKIEIEITNTLRNLLGPYHIPKGEDSHCWSEAWTGEYDRSTRTSYPDWYLKENRIPDTAIWTESYMQKPFGIDSVRICFT